MTSNIFSKLVPTTQGRSFYEELRRREEDTEDRAGLLDEENLNHNFHDYDLDNAEGLGMEDSRTTSGGVTSPTSRGRGRRGGHSQKYGRSTWMPQPEEEEDNDVPASLLVEHHEGEIQRTPGQSRRKTGARHAAAIPGPSQARTQWEAAEAHQRLHNDDIFGPPPARQRSPKLPLHRDGTGQRQEEG